MRRQRQQNQYADQSAQISRRMVIAGASSVLASGLVPMAALADTDPARSTQFDQAYQKLIAGRDIQPGLVKMELPELAENGNMVPFSIAVDSPMTDANYVTSITVLSTANPQPTIATFTFTPASGRAAVSGRLRLAKTQDVIAIAQLSNGSVIAGKTNVAVTVGGCGAG